MATWKAGKASVWLTAELADALNRHESETGSPVNLSALTQEAVRALVGHRTPLDTLAANLDNVSGLTVDLQKALAALQRRVKALEKRAAS